MITLAHSELVTTHHACEEYVWEHWPNTIGLVLAVTGVERTPVEQPDRAT